MQVVVETFTTTGSGPDAPWESPQMNLPVIVLDLAGVVLSFLVLSVLVFPLFEAALSTTVTRRVAADLVDCVVIFTYTSRAD